MTVVPTAVPSLDQSARCPLAASLPKKYSFPPMPTRSLGTTPPEPSLAVVSGRVPATVPSLVQSSKSDPLKAAK